MGVTLVECALGEYPYKGREVWARLSQIVSDAPPTPPPERYSQACLDFIALCLNKNPEERGTFSTLLAHPWLTTSFKDEDVDVATWVVERVAWAKERRRKDAEDKMR